MVIAPDARAAARSAAHLYARCRLADVTPRSADEHARRAQQRVRTRRKIEKQRTGAAKEHEWSCRRSPRFIVSRSKSRPAFCARIVPDYVAASGEINGAILECFRGRGIVMPFPQREVRLIGNAQ
jgi:hypothetical protein